MNVTFPVVGSIVYVPICFPSFVAGIVVSVTGFPSTTNWAGCSGVIVIGAVSSPWVNVGVPSCVLPWMSVVLAGFAVGVTGVTVGV